MREMNIKQANEMLNKIKNSGLHTKTKVAQELVRELELYIRSASMKKQADLRLYISLPNELKKVFFYWASAALSQMTSEPTLQGMTIPSVGSDTPTEYGTKILNQLGGSRMRRRRRQASEAKYANFLNGLFEELKPQIEKGIQSAYGKFVANNKEFESRSNGDIRLEDLWQLASTWATTGRRLVDTSAEGARETDITPWKRISDAVGGGGTIAEKVMGAINKGVFSAMASKNRFLSHKQKQDLGIDKVDGEKRKIRQESIEGQSSSGEDYSKLDQFSAEGFIHNTLGQSDVEKYLDEKSLTEEELETITGLLTDGSMKDKPLMRATMLEVLVRSGHITKDDAFIRTLKLDFMDGKFLSEEAMEKAVEVLELTGNPITQELVDLLQSYASGELDEDAFEDLEGDLIADGWLEDNIEMDLESEEAVKMIMEKAEQMAEVAVKSLSIPEGELGEAVSDLAKKELEVSELKKLLKMFTDDGFHWMLDANLYLDDAEWALALREADPTALKAIQEAIEVHQEPLLPLGLRNILNSAVFADMAKMIAIKEFADNCMDQAAVGKMFNGKAPLAWFIDLAISLNGGQITLVAGGKNHIIKVESMKFFDLNRSTFNGLVKALQFASPSDITKITKDLEDLIAPYKPKAYTSMTMKTFLDNVIEVSKNEKYTSIAKKVKQSLNSSRTSGLKSLKGFYSALASELVRYRFYLDIGFTDGDDLPKGLGNDDCDARVRNLIDSIPRSTVNIVKSEGYDLMLDTWKEDVEALMKARLKTKKSLVNNSRNNVKKVFKEFGIEEGTPLYNAFVDIS